MLDLGLTSNVDEDLLLHLTIPFCLSLVLT
jgi:hypothetical protein